MSSRAKILDIIRGCAETGRPLPYWKTIAGEVGVKDAGTVTRAVAKLVRAGRFTLPRDRGYVHAVFPDGARTEPRPFIIKRGHSK